MKEKNDKALKPSVPYWACLLVIALLVCSFGPVRAAGTQAQGGTAAAQKPQTWTVNLKDADIRAFISQVADITGYSFVVDPRVKGKVTVLSSAPMTKSEIYDLFLSVLEVHGFAAIPGKEAIRIVNQIDAKQSAADLHRFDNRPPPEQLITRVVQVNNANALELIPILRPLVAKYGHLAGVAGSNALVISDVESNVKRIERIVHQLDSPSKYQIDVVQLKHAWVDDVAKLLKDLVPKELGNQAHNNPAYGKYSVVADERSNRLIIRGDDTFRARIESLIHKLDQPAKESSTTRVFKLKHAGAKDLAKVLKGVLGEVAKEQQKKGSTPTAGSNSSGQGFAILSDDALNAIVVRADPAMMRQVVHLVGQLDVRRAQVLIEAAIVEISDNMSKDLGVQFAAGDQSGKAVPALGTNFNNLGNSLTSIISAIAQNQVIGPAPGGLTLGGGQINKNGVSWGVLLQALRNSTQANLLSTPSIITLDNEESQIMVGQNVPFKTGETTNTSAGLSNPFTTIERKDIGLTLKVTPSISSDNVVKLKVDQTTESIANSVQSASDLITNKRQIKTTVLADNGQTIVLGGLIKEDYNTVQSKVPLLGDIPGIGFLFRSTHRDKEKTNLLVFLRPTILRGKGGAAKVTQNRYNSLWQVNLGLRKDRGAKTKGLKKPPLNSLFNENSLKNPPGS